MKSLPMLVVAAAVWIASVPAWASGFATQDPAPRTPKKEGTVGATSFVGIIESINLSNRTIEVYGQDARVRTAYVRNQTDKNRDQVYERTRSLENIGDKETRTFEVGGFCEIRLEGNNERRMAARLGLADLPQGQQVSIDYVKGIGGRYTARSIIPLTALNLNAAEPKKK